MSEATHLSSLAMIDAIHDFNNIAKKYYDIIIESLPGYVEYLRDEDDALKYVHADGKMSPLSITSPNESFRQLGGSNRKGVFILCDASFCVPLAVHLSKNTIGTFALIRNREERNDCGSNVSDETLTMNRILLAEEMLEVDDEHGIDYTRYNFNDTVK